MGATGDGRAEAEAAAAAAAALGLVGEAAAALAAPRVKRSDDMKEGEDEEGCAPPMLPPRRRSRRPALRIFFFSACLFFVRDFFALRLRGSARARLDHSYRRPTNQPPPKTNNSAGAARVDAVESVAHVAAAAERAVAAARLSGRVRVLHKDARFLNVGKQPDGRPGDLDAGADVVVFEVRKEGGGVSAGFCARPFCVVVVDLPP
jgi:hypothetical protein